MYLVVMMELSVVIPAYNEEQRILPTVKKIHSLLSKQKHDFEIIVVDDGSTDRTKQVVEELGLAFTRVVRQPGNTGKGAAVQRGIMESVKEWILFSDADLSTPIEELGKFLSLTKEADIIIGSRNLKGSKIQVKQPFLRSSLGKAFPKIVSLILTMPIKDTQCGFKLFHKRTKHLFSPLLTKGYAFDVEVLYKAMLSGYRIKEVPVIWRNDGRSKGSPLRDSLRMLRDIIRIKLRVKKDNSC